MKKKLLILLIISTLLVGGCDSSLEIVGMEIDTYPDKLIYYPGIDAELDLTGGYVNFIMKANIKEHGSMNHEFITVTHEIDFDTPGIYIVTLKRHKGICQFEIEVVENDKEK